MQTTEICEGCQRPKSTEADLDRWKKEFPKGALGKDPSWARAICWTKPGVRCNVKPIRKTCRTCLRPRATKHDWGRWEKVPGRLATETLPKWVDEICWTVAGRRCPHKPIAATASPN